MALVITATIYVQMAPEDEAANSNDDLIALAAHLRAWLESEEGRTRIGFGRRYNFMAEVVKLDAVNYNSKRPPMRVQLELPIELDSRHGETGDALQKVLRYWYETYATDVADVRALQVEGKAIVGLALSFANKFSIGVWLEQPGGEST